MLHIEDVETFGYELGKFYSELLPVATFSQLREMTISFLRNVKTDINLSDTIVTAKLFMGIGRGWQEQKD
jgi:hypothetical protein